MCLLDSVLSNGGNFLIHGHQFMEMMWLFSFLNVGMNSLVMTFYVRSSQIYISVCVCVRAHAHVRVCACLHEIKIKFSYASLNFILWNV